MKWRLLFAVFATTASTVCINAALQFSPMAARPLAASAFAVNGKTASVATSASSLSLNDATPIRIDVDASLFPAPANVAHQLTVTADLWPLPATTRLAVDGVQLGTIVFQNKATAIWTPSSLGEYALWIEDSNSPGVRESNVLMLMVGQAPNRTPCAGGVLPQTATAAELNDYAARFDTLNCYYIEPPRCPRTPHYRRRCTP